MHPFLSLFSIISAPAALWNSSAASPVTVMAKAAFTAVITLLLLLSFSYHDTISASSANDKDQKQAKKDHSIEAFY
jgi:predicted membrane channel-forming protein YqfA (hemolysin III family)